jgi:hypothetical protein
VPHTGVAEPDGAHVEAKASERWRGLYRTGGIAAILIAVLMLGEVVVYAVLPRTETAVEYFESFADDRLAGLLTLDLLGIIAYLLFIPVILALYVALHEASEAVMAIATALFFVGIADFFATNTAFPVLALSEQYASATTDAERTAVLGAGRALFALFNENAFLFSYVLVSGAWAMIAAVMVRARAFGRATGSAGVLAGVTGILAVLLEHVSADLVDPAIALYFAAIVSLFVWVVLVGLHLHRIGATDS